MSMKDLNKSLEKILKSQSSESLIIEELDEIYDEFGVRQVNAWRNLSNRTKNTLLHELVDKDYLDVVRHVISKYQLRTFFKRESDGLTPLELARLNDNDKMWDLLMEFQDEKTLANTYEQLTTKKAKDKMMNIVWMDLEFTSFQNPQILECAVIVTDKDLVEIERKTWVVHFEQEIIDGLADWHQNAFRDVTEGGNGLFKEVLSSTITKEEMEEELLDLIKRHCPEKTCPLAGSSIHVDKEVMKVEMPTVYNYLHYRVIDVTSFREIIKRWAPQTGAKFSKQLASNGRETVNHRAMDDIEWSIEMMKLFRPLLTSRPFLKETRKVSRTEDEIQCSSEKSDIRKSKLPTIVSSLDRSKLHNDEKQLLKRIEFEQTFDVEQLQLTNDEQRLYDQNPHLREVFINHEQLIYNTQPFTNENRQLIKSSLNDSIIHPTHTRQMNTTEYWTQRKLLLSHIEFLTQFSSEKNCLVIYVGAAHVIYLNYLSSLFPQINFILFDDKHLITNETNQIEIISQTFTDQLARKYSQNKSKNILFICENKTFTNEDQIENDIEKDMNDQMRWFYIIQPYASLLTFRLPRIKRNYLYFNGQLLWDLWSSKTSFQCRLIVQQDTNIIEYDYIQFERAFNHFQNVTRTMFYQNDFDHIQTEGLDHCYDCTAEIFILQEYLIQIKQINQDKQLKRTIAQLSSDISTNIKEEHRPTILNLRRTLNIIQKTIK